VSQIKKEKQNEEKFPKYVLVADVNHVKEYLFASVRLRHIVNASALLSDVNERQTKLLIEQGVIIDENGKCEKVHNDTKAKIIFTGGGVTQAVFNQEEAAGICKKKLEALYPSKTGTATIAVHVEPWTGEEKFVNVIRRAVRKVREKKDSGKSDKEQEFEPIAFSSGSPFFRICEQTGKEFATEWKKTLDGDMQAFGKSVWAQQNWEPDKNSKINLKCGDRLSVDKCLRERLAKDLNIDNPDCLVYKADFEKMTESDAKPQNYLGFMDADGNGMGDLLNTLATEKAKVDDYREFSHILSSSTQEAYLRAAVKVIVPYLKEQRKSNNNEITLPIRLLIMGGDDVMVVSLPQLILPFANEFCREFQRIAKEKKENSESKVVKKLDEFTMSAGVVIAHRGFPFLSFRRLGNRLLKSAKKRSWAAKRDKQRFFGSVDFQIITASGADDLKRLRKDDYTLNFKNEPEISLTGRPYLVSPELDEILNLRHIVAKMKTAQISRRQVKSLSDILMRHDSTSALVKFMQWFNRLNATKTPDTATIQQEIIRDLLNFVLFSVELDLDLDKNTDIPQYLRSLFEKYVEPLSNKVEIEVLRERKRWAINDKGQTYILQKDQKIVFCYLMEMLCVSPWLKDERLGKFKRPDCYTPLLDAAELFDIPDELAQSEIQVKKGGES